MSASVPGRFRIVLAGDVMTGRGVDQILPLPSKPVLYERWVGDARRYVRLGYHLGRALDLTHPR